MIGSLATGYGGLDLAAEHVLGMPTAWVADNDPGAAKILAVRFPDVPNLGDVTAVDWTEVEPIDVLTAGYPCQPFSHAGKRAGADDSRNLWPHVLRAVRQLRPRLVLLENVAGHLSLGFGRVLGDLAEVGYDARWTCLRAADVGAPHGRLRVFVVAADAERGRRAGRASEPGRGPLGRATPSGGGKVAGAAPDPDGGGRARGGRVGRRRTESADRAVASPDADGIEPTVWCGVYAAAIARWERTLGRSAPVPTEPGRNGPRLSPRFVEWLMGLEAGWVTDVPVLARNAQLKALGNGVVPQQAEAALRWLLDVREDSA